jgi:uncharacterized membrane protein YhdT
MVLISTVSLNNSSPSPEARVSLSQLMVWQIFKFLVAGAEGRTDIKANYADCIFTPVIKICLEK